MKQTGHAKYSQFWSTLYKHLKTAYKPSQELSLDEAVTLWRGWLSNYTVQGNLSSTEY